MCVICCRIAVVHQQCLFLCYSQLPQMPSKYNPQLGELIRSMLSKKPEERPDVKHILRQPYIKQQIALFLEATKELRMFHSVCGSLSTVELLFQKRFLLS